MASNLPILNLPSCHLPVEQLGGNARVFDPVRRRMVALTPEEWVRQHLIDYMIHSLGYPAHLMAVERTLRWQRMSKRCDIIVFNPSLQPVLIAEIKAAHVTLDQKTLNQAIRYNQAFKAPYLLLSNGLQHMVILIRTGEGNSINYLDRIPDFDTLKEV